MRRGLRRAAEDARSFGAWFDIVYKSIVFCDEKAQKTKPGSSCVTPCGSCSLIHTWILLVGVLCGGYLGRNMAVSDPYRSMTFHP